jgi:hypothetical protein
MAKAREDTAREEMEKAKEAKAKVEHTHMAKAREDTAREEMEKAKEAKAKEEQTHMEKEETARRGINTRTVERAKTNVGTTEEDTMEDGAVISTMYQRKRCGARFVNGMARHATLQSMMKQRACSRGAAWKDNQSTIAFGNRRGLSKHTTKQ